MLMQVVVVLELSIPLSLSSFINLRPPWTDKGNAPGRGPVSASSFMAASATVRSALNPGTPFTQAPPVTHELGCFNKCTTLRSTKHRSHFQHCFGCTSMALLLVATIRCSLIS
ncbi:hypothetical protein DL93DRAFT_543215 [Clavulina sp. PMI_390]|nr:hypothetical protein DL93DRAFT_543215 [Clavulina sp. PMI_390]